MLKLGILLYEKNEQVCLKISEYFKERASAGCCVCNAKRNKDCKYLNFICPELKEKNAKNFFSSFPHIVCEKCIKDKLYVEFNCYLCNIKHLFDKNHA